MKTKAELIAENNELKAELLKYSYLEQKFKYSQQLVEDLRNKWIKERCESDNLMKENHYYQTQIIELRKQLSSRKKSWLQRWLGI